MFSCSCGLIAGRKHNVQRHIRSRSRYGSLAAAFHQLCSPCPTQAGAAGTVVAPPPFLGAEGEGFGIEGMGDDDYGQDRSEGSEDESDALPVIRGDARILGCAGEQAPMALVQFQDDHRRYVERTRQRVEWTNRDRAQLEKYLFVAGSIHGMRGDACVETISSWANRFGADVVDHESVYAFKSRMKRDTEGLYMTVPVSVEGRREPYMWDCLNVVRAFALQFSCPDLMGEAGVRISFERVEVNGERVFASYMTCRMQEELQAELREQLGGAGAAVDCDGYPLDKDGFPCLAHPSKVFIDTCAVDKAMNLHVSPIVGESLWLPGHLRGGRWGRRLRLCYACVPELEELYTAEALKRFTPAKKLRVKHAFINAVLEQFARVRHGVLLRVSGPGKNKVYRVFFRLVSMPADMKEVDSLTAHYTSGGAHPPQRPCRSCLVSRDVCGTRGHDVGRWKTNRFRRAVATLLTDPNSSEADKKRVSQETSTHDALRPNSLLLDTTVVGTKRFGFTGVVLPDLMHTLKVGHPICPCPCIPAPLVHASLHDPFLHSSTQACNHPSLLCPVRVIGRCTRACTAALARGVNYSGTSSFFSGYSPIFYPPKYSSAMAACLQELLSTRATGPRGRCGTPSRCLPRAR